MIYAALAIAALVLVAAGGLVALVARGYSAQLAAALDRAAAAEAERDAAAEKAEQAQPRHTVDALRIIAGGDDDELLRAIFGDPAGEAGWSAEVESPGRPDDAEA